LYEKYGKHWLYLQKPKVNVSLFSRFYDFVQSEKTSPPCNKKLRPIYTLQPWPKKNVGTPKSLNSLLVNSVFEN
jgi:hypothetical protein